MLKTLLANAHHSGSEVLITLKTPPQDQFKGRIFELTDTALTLFHSGTGGGVLWAFELQDIAYGGLVVELPDLDHVSQRAMPLQLPKLLPTTPKETPSE